MRAKILKITGLVLALAFQAHASKPPYPVIGYLGTWDTVTTSALPWDSLTHVSEAFALPAKNGGTPVITPRSDLTFTAHTNGTKVLMSVGGATASATNWSSSTTPTANLNTFVANIMNLVSSKGYDGVDIDWEFPNAGNSTPAEKTQFMTLMQKLYSALHNSGDPNYKGLAFDGSEKMLTFYISPGYDLCGVDWTTIANYCDYAIQGGYDFYSCSAPVFAGPIEGCGTYTNCFGWSKSLNVKSTSDTLTGGGAQGFSFPKSKLILGLPMFGGDGSYVNANVCAGSSNTQYALARETKWSNGVAVTDTWGLCQKMNWGLNYGLPGFALWEIAYAYPPTQCAEISNMWATLAGTTGCVVVGTPTQTPTLSNSPTQSSTRTSTPMVSPSSTASLSPSRTPTISPTPSRSATLSNTPSPSISPTHSVTNALSPTVSPSFSVSPSRTPSVSATPSRSATLSATPSPSISPTRSVTSAFSPTISPGFSVSPSRTPSASATPSRTATLTRSPTVTVSDTPVVTPTDSATPGGAPPASATPQGNGTELPRPREVMVVPNPLTGSRCLVSMVLEDRADELEFSVYSKALTQVQGSKLAGSFSRGRIGVSLDLDPGLADGIYYVVLTAKNAAGLSRAEKACKLMLLR